MERYRTTIILAGLLIVLGGVAFFLNQNNANTADTATPTPPPTQYVWQETGDVTAIDVVSGTQNVSVRLDVSTTVWSLIAPTREPADGFRISSAADNLKSLKAITPITGTTDLAQFGLDKTGLRIDVKTGGNKPAKHTALVGNANMDGTGYYVKMPDAATVYLVDYSIIEPLKSWLITPPKAQPTPTPVELTIAPTETITPTNTMTLTLPITSTTTVSDTGSITTTVPGAANPTTPVATP